MNRWAENFREPRSLSDLGIRGEGKTDLSHLLCSFEANSCSI